MKKLAWLLIVFCSMVQARNVTLSFQPNAACGGEYKVKIYSVKRVMHAHCWRGICSHVWPRVRVNEQEKYLRQGDSQADRTFHDYSEKHPITVEVTSKTENSRGRCRYKRGERSRISISPGEQNVQLYYPRDF